jgi:alpha-beta hydrolase superfamily lysophospholipase
MVMQIKYFLTGHSAGGHLIALATTNPKYNVPKIPCEIILNDAAGLDMYSYLKQIPPTTE